MNGVIGAGVILSVMGGGVFYNVLAAPNAWPDRYAPHHPSASLGQPLFVCAGTEWLVPKSPVAFHSLGLLPVCIDSLLPLWRGWRHLCAPGLASTALIHAPGL